MAQTKTKFNYPKIVSGLLKLLSGRHQDVVARRFGLHGKGVETLDSIGRNYSITRERVRQIEAFNMKQIRSSQRFDDLQDMYSKIQQHIHERGGLQKESDLFSELSPNSKHHPHLNFLLTLSSNFRRAAENSRFHAYWLVNNKAHSLANNFVQRLVLDLEKDKAPQEEGKFLSFAKNLASGNFPYPLKEIVLKSHLALSKEICCGPFGHYGLRHWSEINPRGVRDKAYLVFHKEERPLHFREVSSLINKINFPRIYTSTYRKVADSPEKNLSAKKVNSQTVHNELIKDDRFVLVGRGTYALARWGYEPGVVKDVIANLLKSEGPLVPDDIVKKIKEKRLVKEKTVLFNLRDQDSFKRMSDGRYNIA